MTGSQTDSDAMASARADWLGQIPALLDFPLTVINPKGEIEFANPAWHRLCRDAALPPLKPGALYGDFLNAAAGKTFTQAAILACHLEAFLKGESAEFREETSFLSGKQQRWLVLRGTRMGNRVLITHEETTALARTHQELRESHTLFRHVLDHVRDGIFLYDLENRLVMANRHFAEGLGLPLQKVIGKSIFELYEPEVARTVHEQNILILTTGREFNFEISLPGPNGDRKVLVRKGIYRNHRDEATGVFGIGYDTGGEGMQEALARSERHFRALIENSSNRVALLNADGKISYASPSSLRMVGFEMDELIGSNAFLWIHPSDLAPFMRKFQRLLATPGAVISGEYRTLCKGGRWVWMEATYTNLLHDPNVRAIVLNERDVSERKQVEFELTQFARIIQSSSEGIFSTDYEGHVISWNPAAETIFGYREREMIGKKTAILIPPRRRREYDRIRATTLRGSGAEDVEIVMLRKGGTPIQVQLTLSPIRDRDRQIIGVSKIARDITERRRLEKEILEIADREKQRLGQDLHDDLCQHLVGIGLISNLLRDDLAALKLPQSSEAGKVADLVAQAVDHARRLARGLCPLQLTGSGFTGGIETLVNNTARLFRCPCHFECESPAAIEDQGVATHLYRITQEALHNAVKHSQAERIVVRLNGGPSLLEITVSDNGVGLPRRQEPGTGNHGLGMHTMRYRARIIGATLEFSRPPGGGTALTCRLPLSEARAEAEEAG